MNKEAWPELRLFWLENPNMSSLRELASHLREKTEGRGSLSGFKGVGSDIDQQINAHLSALEQEVFALEDVVEALLEIIGTEHEHRLSQRVKRALRGVWEKANAVTDRVGQNPAYKVIALILTVASAIAILLSLLLHFWKA